MGRSRFIIAATCGFASVGIAFAIVNGGIFNRPEWTRQSPLANPVQVQRVHSGQITLSDGRTLRPAGIVAAENVTPSEYDHALRVATAQGIEVIRDLGNGTAMLLVEPKFYNWCGTSSRRWAGVYVKCSLSELMVYVGYAAPAYENAGLTTMEQWRIDGVKEVLRQEVQPEPTHISERSNAFSFDGYARLLSSPDLNDLLSSQWRPPP